MASGIPVTTLPHTAVGTLARYDAKGPIFLSNESLAVSKEPVAIPPDRAAITRKGGNPKPLQEKPYLHLSSWKHSEWLVLTLLGR